MAKPTHRPINDINQDYYRKSAELGNLQFRLVRLPEQIEECEREMRKLNKEADEAQGAEMKKAQEKALVAAQKAKDQPSEEATPQ